MKDNVKIFLYLLLFIILFITVKFNSSSLSSNSNVKSDSKYNVIDKLSNIDNTSYRVNLQVIERDNTFSLDLEVMDDISIGKYYYLSNIYEFIKYDNIYYSYNDKLNILDLDIPFNYDKTFIYLDNFKKLISLVDSYSYKESYLVFNIDLSKVLSEYNLINNKNFYDLDNNKIEGYVILDSSNNISYFLIDFTSLYNTIYEDNIDSIVYKISYSSLDKEDNSYLIDLIKNNI